MEDAHSSSPYYDAVEWFTEKDQNLRHREEEPRENAV